MGKEKLKKLYDILFGNHILKNAKKIIAVTDIEKEQLKNFGISEEKIEIIPNGIDLEKYENLPSRGCFRKKFGIYEDEKIVLYLGRIHRIKRIDILVKAFADIIEDLDDVKLVIVGPDDGYLADIESLIKDLKIENNILITGPLYGMDKLEAYVDADVYVLPSSYEIWGMTIIEAMACGTPILITQNCGLADFVDNNVGVTFELDCENLKETLFEMLTNDKKLKIFREKCKEVVKTFDIKRVVKKLENVYLSIIKK